MQNKNTIAYKNKLAYTKEFTKANYRQVTLMLHKGNDGDIIEWLDAQQNKNGYLKDLIRKDIKVKPMKKKAKHLYVSNRHGDWIEEVETVEEGIELIKAFVKEDEEESHDGDPSFYEIEDEEHMTVWYMDEYFNDYGE